MAIEARALRRGVVGADVVRTGIGPERSRRAVAALRDHPARALAVAGVAGSLDPDLAPGTVVVATALSGGKGGGSCARVELSGASALVSCLARIGQRAVAAPILSVDHVVRGRERARLFERGVCVVDMESVWLAAAAGARPLAVLRVIVDAPGRGFAGVSLLRNGARALRTLRRAAAAVEIWAAEANAFGDVR